MNKQGNGMVILHSVPGKAVEHKIKTYLSASLDHASEQRIESMLQKMPVILRKDLTELEGRRLVKQLSSIGASASYVEELDDEAAVPIDLPEPELVSLQPAAAAPPEVFPESFHQAAQVKSKTGWVQRLLRQLEQVNKELWLIASMFVIAGVMNYMVTGHRLLLGFYTLPTLMSAYYYGRRHATLTALASVLMVILVVHFNPVLFKQPVTVEIMDGKWYDIACWGLILMITGYAMGTLYERNQARLKELRQTYQGLIVILRHFISKDKYTENHCYRVSIYAVKIASYLGFTADRIEDIRSAALLHDIGKVDISRELLYKAAKLNWDEYQGLKSHVDKGVDMLSTVSNTPLGRIIPIILGHHERFDGSGYFAQHGENIPLESRVLAVADVYDALISDRPYRKAMSPFQAREIIVQGAGTDFDPKVVKAFLRAFDRREMDVPNVII